MGQPVWKQLIAVSSLFIGLTSMTFMVDEILAAGGGGGGSSGGGVVCAADTWICTEWGECSAAGKQSRTCAINFDCPFGDTPKPAEEQPCTPPCTGDLWTCTEWSACAAGSTGSNQTRACTLTNDCPTTETPKPAETQTCAPSKSSPTLPPPTATAPKQPATCNADTWNCQPWSPCDREGKQKRPCQKTFDCAAADTEQPPGERRCQEIQCGNKATLRDRIQCRLGLSPSGLGRELELEYLPEECRFSPSGSPARSQCIELYKSFRPCWRLAVGPERSACARKIITLPEDLKEQAAICRQRFEPETCLNELRQKASKMIKFRFYDLEQRAENLIDYGADVKLVTEFVATVYEKKDAFNRAATLSDRRKIILEVRAAWQDFARRVKGEVKDVDETKTSARYRLFY